MKFLIRFFCLALLFGCVQIASAQVAGPKIVRVDIKYVGPESVSEQYIRANIHVKPGDTYIPDSTEQDVHALYGTGQFYNIRISIDETNDGVALTYIVQPRPRISEIKIEGNKKLSDSKLRKKVTVKAGDPLDEQKLFTDAQEMKTLYEKYGYADTTVKYAVNVDDATGRGTVTFEITETPKVKIKEVDFVGANAFSQKKLRGEIKTRRHWMFSWITQHGYFKADQFDDDKDALTEFYRSKGYLDFEIKDVKFVHPTPNEMVIRFYIYEGRQYKVGSVKFVGNKIFNEAQIVQGIKDVHNFQNSRDKMGPHGLFMDVGDIFTPEGLDKDTKAVEDFYGSRGYIDVAESGLQVNKIPNVDAGTMDLEFQIDEGQQYRVEKIEIRGNTRTKDKVIRRELAISPGEVFDMVRVQLSKDRLDNLQYFSKVDARPEPTDPPITGRDNLVVNVEEQNTGKVTLGAGFSTVDALVGYLEVEQGNFDLFNPPYFTGGGEKIRLLMQLGTKRQDYELTFIEPWFLDRKLAFSVDLYRHQLDYESPNSIYNEDLTGMTLGLTRALPPPTFLTKLLGNGDLSAGAHVTIEDVGITLNSPFHGSYYGATGTPPVPGFIKANTPKAILEQRGDHLYERVGATIAYDTRNNTRLPNHGQRTELDGEISYGDTTFYKLEAKTAWFFPGFFRGHVVEVDARTGVADAISGGNVPFYDRFFLGGPYDMRGFKYRNVAPRQPGFIGVDEPIGGDTYWVGSVEYSIPILEKDNGVSLRVAGFYDAGSVAAQPFSYSGPFDDDWGLGIRLNIPHLGPLRLDYGFPIHHDSNNSASGQFQFSVGWTHGF
ncbi:MAG TPA: outer membrane protein assembly factor BamA [Verrucomicrobiae bacterium]|nr:outer membrane protein assembly factor BamA [Verrucomicrobiae bacterium]